MTSSAARWLTGLPELTATRWWSRRIHRYSCSGPRTAAARFAQNPGESGSESVDSASAAGRRAPAADDRPDRSFGERYGRSLESCSKLARAGWGQHAETRAASAGGNSKITSSTMRERSPGWSQSPHETSSGPQAACWQTGYPPHKQVMLQHNTVQQRCLSRSRKSL